MSPAMSLSATLPQAILDTILAHLAILFLTAAGDDTAARSAARQMLAAYHPETAEELSLAAEIISFSFHALEALGQAANPELSLSRTIRLRGSAVSLSREAHKSQRKLDKLQQARRSGTQPRSAQSEAAKPQAVHPETETAPAILQASGTPAVQPAMQTARPILGPTGGKIPHAQAPQKRMTANRLSKKARKAAARQACLIARTNAAAAASIPPAARPSPPTS